MLEIFVIPLLRRLLIFFNFQNSIRAHVGHRAFATLQIELYPVVEYDSKWSTKFHKYCMLEFFLNCTFKMSFDIYIFNFQNSIRAPCRTQSLCNTPN